MTVPRRAFLASTAAALVSVRAPTSAQQGKVHRIGYANLRGGPGAADMAFVAGMRALGYVVGDNLVIEYRWANNDLALFQSQIEDLVRLRVDLIVTSATPAIRATMRVTNAIPIVMAVAADPVGTGLVASLSRPGGNVTGLSVMSTDLAQKRLQLLRDVMPAVARVAVLGWERDQRHTEVMIAETEAAGRQMGIAVIPQVVANEGDIDSAFARFASLLAQAVIVDVSTFAFEHRERIVRLAAQRRLADIYGLRAFVDAGGLLSYGPDAADSYRRAATYVDKILRGAKPADLPVEQPEKFELIISAKTAAALGLVVPPAIFARADEVIE